MIGDILEALFEDLPVGRGLPSRGVQVATRLFFGLLGAGLGTAGVFKFATDPDLTRNVALRFSVVCLFAFLACFCLFNVGFVRKWRWPGRLFLASLALVFVARLALGP